MAKTKKLTDDQIQAISSLLHEHIQFYDVAGNEANNLMIKEIEDTLRAHELPVEATEESR